MSFFDNIRRVTPYTPGEQPQRKVIKLNTNECPYPPAPGVARAIAEVEEGRYRLYPDPACTGLCQAIADYYGLEREQVFVGVGSDDVLSMCFMTFFAGKKPILFADITYSFYDVWADVYRIPFERVPLREDYTIAAEDYRGENGGIVICNPNAPTGLEAPQSVIETVLKNNPDSVVVVDEAYADFAKETSLPLLEKYPNLVIVRTMSKSRALAGMRVGYAFGSKELIRAMHDVKFSVNSYTMNMSALAAGVAAIEDRAYFESIVERVVATREWTIKELTRLGFHCLPSNTNFILARAPKDAGALFEELKKKDIFVRYFNKPRLSEYLRITVGTDEEMQKFIAALEELL